MTLQAEGLYKAKVVGWGFGESSKGTPCFELRTRLFARVPDTGDAPEGLDEEVGRTVQLWLTPKTMDATAAQLREHFGYTDTTLSRLHPSHPEAFDLSGKVVTVSVKHGEYNGRPQERVQLQRESKRLKLAEMEALKDLDALFGEHQRDNVKGDADDSAPPSSGPAGDADLFPAEDALVDADRLARLDPNNDPEFMDKGKSEEAAPVRKTRARK